MALKKEHVNIQGFSSPNSYAVVETVEYRKGSKAQAFVAIYKDKTARDNGLGAMDSALVIFDFDTSPSAKHALDQAYEAAKQLPEMANATDA